MKNAAQLWLADRWRHARGPAPWVFSCCCRLWPAGGAIALRWPGSAAPNAASSGTRSGHSCGCEHTETPRLHLLLDLWTIRSIDLANLTYKTKEFHLFKPDAPWVRGFTSPMIQRPKSWGCWKSCDLKDEDVWCLNCCRFSDLTGLQHSCFGFSFLNYFPSPIFQDVKRFLHEAVSGWWPQTEREERRSKGVCFVVLWPLLF